MSGKEKKCLKCGHVRTSVDNNVPEHSCPKCGAVYAKIEAAMRAKAVPASVSAPSQRATQAAGHADTNANAELARLLEDRVKKGKKIAHLVYALFLVGFAFPLLWILAVIVAHVTRSPDNEGWLNEHFGWQIRTFWYGLAWGGVMGVLYTGLAPVFFRGLIGGGPELAGAVLVTWVATGVASMLALWLIYRIIRGWVFLFKESTP